MSGVVARSRLFKRFDDRSLGSRPELMLPTLRRIVRYRGGIAWRIEKLAQRYGCPDYYEPGR